VTSVAFAFDATGAPAASRLVLPDVVTDARSRAGAGFASLIDTENMTLTVVLLALLAAFGFGALHALEPGHGKTLVAAYFVGIKGSAREALLLGLVIAATHTIGVLTIGLIAIFASQWILPETLYPWLRLASGLMVLALGVRLVTMRGGGRFLHRLTHLLPWGHHHHHDHDDAPAQTGVPPWRSLIALGLADGLTPSPSALIVLLAAVSLGRIGLGIGLIVSFSVGLSAVLAVISLGLLYARQIAERLRTHRLVARLPLGASITGNGTLARVLPLTGAVVLVGVGIVLTLRALPAAGLGL
jgi:ABC-type nickel/cobalt efflux system permease component RcnA